MSELRYWRHRAEPRHVTTVSMVGTINAPQWEPVSVLTDAELASVERAAAEKALTGVTDLIDAKAKAYADSATGLCAEKEWLDSNRYSNYASGLDMAAGLLHKAAEAYRREEA